MQPEILTFAEPDDVNQELSAFGLSIELLKPVIESAALGRLNTNPLCPPTIPGISQWGDGVAAIREILLPRGWKSYDLQNRGLIFSPDKGIAIAIAGGDSDTGIPDGVPTTRATRGPSTKNAIESNMGQLELLPEYFERPAEISEDELGTFWLLLIHVDKDAQVARAEFSRPMGWSSERRPTYFSPRYILPSVPLDGGPVMMNFEEPIIPSTPEIKIEIKRRA